MEFSGSNEEGRGVGSYIRGVTPVARGGGRQTPPVARGGATGPFFSRDLVANLKKKITLRACRPMGGRPGDIFEIFQNGNIFLKFLFFKNIKKKKAPLIHALKQLKVLQIKLPAH